jgi:stage II sporulation protein AA (anti-sigma F factor antagonist)
VSGEVAVMVLSGDVDLIRAPSLRTELMAAVDNRHAGLVVDLSEVSYMDSAGVNVLFEVADELRQHQLGIALVIPPGSIVERVVTLVDLGSVAPILRDVEAALAHVREQGS